MQAAKRPEHAVTEQIDSALFREPLEFIFADHYRQRVVCNTLEAIVSDPSHGREEEDIRAIIDYLEHDLPLHVADEEESLFPLLLQRCEPVDNIGEVLAILGDEHDKDQALTAAVKQGLTALLEHRDEDDLEACFRNTLAFVETQRRHLAWENGIVLPLARKRLGSADLIDLGRAMATRRGQSLPD